MSKLSLSIDMKNATTGETYQRSVTDINPNATHTQLKNFAQGLVGLTQNTYNSTTLVEKTDLDITKNNPAFTGDKASLSWAALANGDYVTMSSQPAAYINEGGRIYIKSFTAAVFVNVTGSNTTNGFSPFVNILSHAFCEQFYDQATAENPAYDAASMTELTREHTGTIVVARTETESYAPAEFTITITA